MIRNAQYDIVKNNQNDNAYDQLLVLKLQMKHNVKVSDIVVGEI
jgi:hypothetical protein